MAKTRKKRSYTVEVAPKLSPEDRKALSRYLSGLPQARPGYFNRTSFGFEYRGSMVTVRPIGEEETAKKTVESELKYGLTKKQWDRVYDIEDQVRELVEELAELNGEEAEELLSELLHFVATDNEENDNDGR